MGRIIQAFDCLVDEVSDADMLEVSFYGSIDASMIHMDRFCMSDLFELAAALGGMRYRPFRPSMGQADTLLMAAGEKRDVSVCPDWLKSERHMLADKLMARFCPVTMRGNLVAVCHAVICERPIPDRLQNLRYESIP